MGTIGSGQVAQTIAGAAIEAGHQVTLNNSRGPDSLKDLVSQFGDQASAGTTAEAAQADIVILAVRWAQVPDAVKGVPDWDGRIVIDATNQSLTGADAKAIVSTFIESLGLLPVDLGGASEERLMQWHRPLNSLHLVKIA